MSLVNLQRRGSGYRTLTNSDFSSYFSMDSAIPGECELFVGDDEGFLSIFFVLQRTKGLLSFQAWLGNADGFRAILAYQSHLSDSVSWMFCRENRSDAE